jgi:hypothetical protein
MTLVKNEIFERKDAKLLRYKENNVLKIQTLRLKALAFLAFKKSKQHIKVNSNRYSILFCRDLKPIFYCG